MDTFRNKPLFMSDKYRFYEQYDANTCVLIEIEK